MRISAAELNRYREALHEIGREASDYVRESIEALGEGAGVTAAREAAIAAIQDTVGIHGEMAQALASQLFDEVCQAEGLGVLDFELMDDLIDFGMLEEKVRYFAKALVDGNGGQFADDCSELANMYVWRCNRDAMVRNCERSGVRYARVPTNANPCDWCVMLASRGFVYHSADRAEAGGHEHCQCVVCPGGANTTVDGYDPDALYDQWKDSGFMPSGGSGGRNLNKFERQRLVDWTNDTISAFENVTDMDQLKAVMDKVNETWSKSGSAFTDSQIDGVRSAFRRARRRLS